MVSKRNIVRGHRPRLQWGTHSAILRPVIQRTALWILATLAFYSPSVPWFDSVADSPSAGQVVQAVHDGFECSGSRSAVRLPRRPQACDGYAASLEVPLNTGRLCFGSLYNRPPPVPRSHLT